MLGQERGIAGVETRRVIVSQMKSNIEKELDELKEWEERCQDKLNHIKATRQKQLDSLEQIKAGNPMRIRSPVYEFIMQAVCTALNVEPYLLGTKNRPRKVVLARSLVAHLSRKYTSMSFPMICQGMGLTAHSSTIAACRRWQERLDSGEEVDPGGGETCEELQARIEAQIQNWLAVARGSAGLQ